MDFKPEFVEQVIARRVRLRAELATIFPGPRALVWEIGCGHGHFLTRYATAFPGKFCAGVDLVRERIAKGRRKAERAALSNCVFVLSEAREFLHALPSAVTFAEIWVLFPDPWPKKRHHKNRLLQPEFLEAVASRVAPGAPLHFRTDHAEYFRTVAEFIPTLKTWQPLVNAEWPLEHETVFQARAASYQSLIAVRTSHPARPVELVAPGLPPPTGPRLFA